MKSICKFPIFCVLLSIFFLNFTSAAGDEYLAFAEKMPEVVGGIKEVYKNIEYPTAARTAGTQGKVYLLVYVNEDGSVAEIKKIKGIGHGCDEAALSALEKVKFTPGQHLGAKVKVKLAMAIEFKLS